MQLTEAIFNVRTARPSLTECNYIIYLVSATDALLTQFGLRIKLIMKRDED